MLSGSLLLSLPPVLSWSTTPLEQNISQYDVIKISENIIFGQQSIGQHLSPSDSSHARDGGLAEQPLVLLELPVPLVRPDARLRCCQVSVPTADYVSGLEMDLVSGKICMNVALCQTS